MSDPNLIFEPRIQRYKRCFVPSCRKTDSKLYSFPCPSKHKERYLRWANACQNPRIRNYAVENVRKNARICKIHFKESDFIPLSNRKLYSYAVPSLHLPPKTEDYGDANLAAQIVDLPNEEPDKSLTDVELHLDIPFKDIPYVSTVDGEHVAIKTISEGINSVLDSTPELFSKLPKFVRKKRSKLITDTQNDLVFSNTESIRTVNCRICLAHTIQTFSIVEKPEIAEMLESLISTKIIKTDLVPTMICLKCFLNLKLAYSIQQKMLKAERNLQEKFKSEQIDGVINFNENSDDFDSIQLNEDISISTNKIKKKRRRNLANNCLNSERKLESCPLCCKKFLNLENHLTRHNRNSSLCEVCGVSMPALNLRLHKMTKHKVFTFKCKFCDKIFQTKCRKEVHEARDHSGQPSHMCDICGKRFYLAKYLKIHVTNVHYNKRPYVCEICSGTFRNFYTLSVHQRVHTEVKPFECNICYKKFKQKQKLKRHLLNVHQVLEELDWKCDECDMSCATESTLTTHKRIHF